MITITRKLEWDSGHRVLGHEGRCKHLHGHHYVAEVTVEYNDGLDSLGRVVDFSVIKGRVGGWIDDCLDHNMILHPDDPLLTVLNVIHPLTRGEMNFDQLTGGREPYIMPKGENPTAENLAKLIVNVATDLLKADGLTVVKVRVWETPNCYADYTPQCEKVK